MGRLRGHSRRKVFDIKKLLLAALLLAGTHSSIAQVHSEKDRSFMSNAFDGVWVVSSSSETIRIRIEPEGLSVLVDESTYFRGAKVIDINREEKAITFEFDNRQFSLTRVGSDFIKFSNDQLILRGERARRLSSQDHQTLDIWYKFEPNPCGNFNQFCEEDE